MACALAHVLLAQVVPWPWWVPNLTLVGVVLGICRAPAKWPMVSALAGLFMLPWAIRFPTQLVLGYLACGWLVRVLATQWDTDEGRIQSALVLVVSSGMTFGVLWLEDLTSLPLIGLALIHVALTTLSVPVMRRLWPVH